LRARIDCIRLEVDPELAIANMKALHELAAKGALKPCISHCFPLAQAAKAMQAVIDRKVIGKAVLVG
jgi:NADPH:quinone reductase-like Zn-dependent oxidoreductase